MEKDDVLKGIGQRISRRRRQLRMTQEELAARMDVSTQMISYAEQGRKAIRPENLIKLCAELEVSADYILTGRATEPGIPAHCREALPAFRGGADPGGANHRRLRGAGRKVKFSSPCRKTPGGCGDNS